MMLDCMRERVNVKIRKCECRSQSNGLCTYDGFSGVKLPCLYTHGKVVLCVASGDISSANMSSTWLSGVEPPCFCMSFNTVLVGEMGEISTGPLYSDDWSFAAAS